MSELDAGAGSSCCRTAAALPHLVVQDGSHLVEVACTQPMSPGHALQVARPELHRAQRLCTEMGGPTSMHRIGAYSSQTACTMCATS